MPRQQQIGGHISGYYKMAFKMMIREVRIKLYINIAIYQSMKPRRRTQDRGMPIFKIILTGDSAAGKSCLLIRYAKQYFESQHNVTIGAEFQNKKIKIDQLNSIRLQIWDTAGQETFRSIIKTFYRNSSAVMLVYKIIDKKSFQSLDRWLAEARQNSPSHAMYFVVGTHLDLEEQRQVDKEDVEQFCNKNNISCFFQTSAKENINVTLVFQELGKQIYYSSLKRRQSTGQIKSTSKIELEEEIHKEKQKNCC